MSPRVSMSFISSFGRFAYERRGTFLFPDHQIDRKPNECDRADREYCVAEQTHPSQSLHEIGLHELRTTRIPVTLRHRLISLQQTDRQQTEKYFHQHSDVDRPEREAEQLRIPLSLRLHRT